MHTEAEARALVQTIGEYSVYHFDKKNLQKLAVRYQPATEHADIFVATKNGAREERDAIYEKFIEEIIPLYIDDATLTLRFFEPSSPIFDETREEAANILGAKNKSYIMA
ncbi:hypothetical protein [Rothia sp. (in: high G+C Gram-positive bacteria)]|uniref:hypothetical protein n=1 Tax=Rothia sp. (in: high G+C Gram-positive bacteria) TaxID=1885016 RepID=UPI0032177C47